jgi:TP901 family phage tail tape measure protein
VAAPVARSVTTRLTIDARGWVAGGQVAQASSRRTAQVAQQGARDAIRAFREQQAAQEKAAAAAERAAQRSAREQTRAAQTAAREAEKAARQQEAATKRAAAEAERSAARAREASTKLGTGLLAVGAAGAAGLGYMVKSFMDFDSAMSAAQAGTMATGSSLRALREAAIQAGADTQFSATEAAQAITAMGKAGVSTQDILGGGLRGALSLAASGQIEVGQAAEIAATAMTQFGLSGAQLPHVADLLAAGAGKAQGEVTDLANALKFVGPVSKGMGVSIEETTGVLAEFASQGIIGEQAGTGLRGVMLSLTSPSKAAANEMGRLGIQVYDSSGKFVGLQGVAGQLQTQLGGLDAATRDAALGQIFGNEQITAARVLYSGGAKAVADWTAKVNDTGFAARQAAMLTNNLKGDVERLGGSLSSVLIKNGGGANDMLRSLTQTTQSVIDGFGGLPPEVQGGATAMLALTTATALAGGGLLTILPKVTAARVAMTELTGSATAATTSLKILGGAFAVAGVAIGAVELGTYVGKAQVADVNTRKLAESLGALGQGGQLSGAGLDVLSTRFGPFHDNVGTTAEALDRFGVSAYNALDQGWDARIGRWQSMGVKTSQFRDQVTQLDAGLADLVKRGAADQASAAFDRLTKAAVAQGVPLAVIQKQFPDYQAALAGTTEATKEATRAAGPMAAKVLTVQQALADYASTAKAGDPSTYAIADAMLALGQTSGKVGDDVKGLAKAMDEWRVKVEDSFNSATDVLGNFSAKTGKGAASVATQLQRSYRDTVRHARQFAADIATATRRGLNADEVARLLEAGPEKAGPILRAMVSDNSGKLIGMANRAQGQLSRIQARVAEQTRLTNIAVNSSSDTMVRDLGSAMRIAEVVARRGGQKTATAIARELGIGAKDVDRISRQFGISIDRNTGKGTTAAGRHVTDFGSKITHLPDSHSTRFTTPGLPGATSAVDNLRQKLSDLAKRDHISVSVAVGVANKLKAQDPANRAYGGPVYGPGGPREDLIPAMLSNREWVHPVDAVDTYGARFMHAVQTRQFPVELAQAFAAGGQALHGDVRISGRSDLGGALTPVTRAISAAASAAQAAAAVDASGASIHGGSVGGGVARWAPLVLRVLRELGQSSSNLAGVLRRIRFESGGNPRAINLTDSNARAGHPSRGLMQTIPGTFNAYAGPYRSRGIVDPLASIYAGLNYAIHRYGSVASIDPLNRPRGYARGGPVTARPVASYRGGFPGARRYAAGGPVTGGDYSGIAAIVQARVSVTAQDRTDRQAALRTAQSNLTAATKALADSRRKDTKAEADARGAVRSARGSLTAARTAAGRRGLTSTQRAAARARVTAATERLHAAERRLTAARRDPNTARAETAIVTRRRALAQANTALHATERALATQSRPLAVRTAEAAYTRNRITGTYIRNLETLASRGFGDLARQLSEMGGDDAQTLAAQAVGSRALAGKLQTDFTVSARLAAQQASLPARLAITSALRTQRNPTIAGLSASTGIATSDLQAAALAMRGSLGRNTNARALLSGVGTNTTTGGFGQAPAGGDQIVVQVASTGNPWLDGERALAGARRVKSVGSSRRF